MIRYALHCDRNHDFESWFQSSSAYVSQVKRKLVVEELLQATPFAGDPGLV